LKADPSAQQQLLAVQELDSRADHLRHQRASLPEIVRIAQLETGRGDLDDRLRDARIVVDDLTV
jgi:predicted  nucleic acid-binding Zn-ribbon protein